MSVATWHLGIALTTLFSEVLSTHTADTCIQVSGQMFLHPLVNKIKKFCVEVKVCLKPQGKKTLPVLSLIMQHDTH